MGVQSLISYSYVCPSASTQAGRQPAMTLKHRCWVALNCPHASKKLMCHRQVWWYCRSAAARNISARYNQHRPAANPLIDDLAATASPCLSARHRDLTAAGCGCGIGDKITDPSMITRLSFRIRWAGIRTAKSPKSAYREKQHWRMTR